MLDGFLSVELDDSEGNLGALLPVGSNNIIAIISQHEILFRQFFTLPDCWNAETTFIFIYFFLPEDRCRISLSRTEESERATRHSFGIG